MVWQPPPNQGQMIQPGPQPQPAPGTQVGPQQQQQAQLQGAQPEVTPYPPFNGQTPYQPMQQQQMSPPPAIGGGLLGGALGLAAGMYGTPNMAQVSNQRLVDSTGQPSNAPLHMDNGDLWRWALPKLIILAVLAYIAGFFNLIGWVGDKFSWW